MAREKTGAAPGPFDANMPRTADIKADIASVPGISLGHGKRADYQTILNRNTRRVAEGERSWDPRNMEKAAGIDSSQARKIRESLGDDTPRTAAIKADIERIPGISLGEGKTSDYLTILNRNEARVADGQETWNSRSMEKTAGIDPAQARRIRDSAGDDTPRMAAIKADIAEIPGINLGQKKSIDYQIILNRNAARVAAGQESWNLRSMEKAARIDPANANLIRQSARGDTPRTAAIKADIEGVPDISLGAGKTADYKTILNRNEARVANGQVAWNARSMEKAAAINPTQAKKIRESARVDTPEVVSIRADIARNPEISLGHGKSADYRTILNRNTERVAAGRKPWDRRCMEKAARIDPDHARQIREAAGSDTPRTAAIKADIDSIPEISLGQGKNRDYQTILNRNDARVANGQEPWSSRSMEKAAAIAPAQARTIRQSMGDRTPRTAAIISEFDNIPEVNLGEGNAADYRTILHWNKERVADGQEGWNPRSMEKAAAINPAQASRIRLLEGDDSPRTAAIKTDIGEISGISLGQGKIADYRTILQRNEERVAAGQEPWNRKSMERAANIEPAHASRYRQSIEQDTPRMTAIKADIAEIPEISLGENKSNNYRTILQRNDQRVADGLEPWNSRSMEKAAGVASMQARTIRQLRGDDTPRITAIKADISDIPGISLGQKKSDDYRTILLRNEQRVEAGEESWDSKSMERAANISAAQASKIRQSAGWHC